MRSNWVLRALVCLLLLGAAARAADGNKTDPLFAAVPQENNRDLVVEVVDWGWVGGLMRRGRVRLHENDFNRTLANLAKNSKKGLTNKDIQGGIRGVARSSRGTFSGVLQGVQNIVILVDVTGKLYIWNKADGAPVPIPESDKLYEQIEAALKEQPKARAPASPSEAKAESKDDYLEEFQSELDKKGPHE